MQDLSGQHTVKPFNWFPSNLVLKGQYGRLCNNQGCYSLATVVFQEGNAIWKCCDECRPYGIAVLVELKTNAEISVPTPERGNDQKNA